ncbi:serine hydrolase [Candidatus Berkiella aquae]|uniref:Beta-lactamase n=1 Tax=Candidatus Berkiella aquae TaxID=295108 RepID=A0A0Q9YPJ9_9GAMM|nr:serine hydrolase [Candidatus Berkiella aquae]MCS5709916.1 serine hydrolase [Candidatus Berkiella aquae]
MGKWSDNEALMRSSVRQEIIKALWEKIKVNGLEQFNILKIVLGLLEPIEQGYLETEYSRKFDEAVHKDDFMTFQQIIENTLRRTAKKKVLSRTSDSVTLGDIEDEVDKTLAEIQSGEHLSMPLVDEVDPMITPEDIADLKEYMDEIQFSGSVSIFNRDQMYPPLEQEKFGDNPIFSIHSVAKVFTGILLMKMIRDGIISEDDIDKPIQLSDSVLQELSPAVQERLSHATLKQIMLHQNGLGDYLDNASGHAADIEQKLNAGQAVPEIKSSHDLLKYGEKKVLNPLGQFSYSNLGMLLLGFAIEKKYQDAQQAKGETPSLGIDEIMRHFVKEDVGLKVFENKRPEKGYYAEKQRNLQDKKPDYIKQYVSARYASTAGGYWTTNEDLQRFAQWIRAECERDSRFKQLIERYGAEFYNPQKQAVEHSGIHADTAHFYTSLRNGTTICILSDQGERAATNLADMILKQTTWYKSQRIATEFEITPQVRPVSPAYDRALSLASTSQPVEETSLEVKKDSGNKLGK